MELERLVFFSDAVMAIAITLLVVELSIPAATEDVGDALLDRWPQMLSFVLSFLVIGIFWMAHHRIFRYVARIDQRLIWLNLLFLMCVAFLPFPTAVLGDHDDSQGAIVFYACAVGLTGAVLASIWQYLHPRRASERAGGPEDRPVPDPSIARHPGLVPRLGPALVRQPATRRGLLVRAVRAHRRHQRPPSPKLASANLRE